MDKMTVNRSKLMESQKMFRVELKPVVYIVLLRYSVKLTFIASRKL